MTLRTLDRHNESTRIPEIAWLQARDAVQMFVEQFRDTLLAPYAIDNEPLWKLLFEWCVAQDVPITSHNLYCALMALEEDGTLAPPVPEPPDPELEAFHQFVAENPAWESYRSHDNAKAVGNYLEAHKLEVTVENVRTAFHELVRTKRIKPVEVLPTVRVASVTEARAIQAHKAQQVRESLGADALRVDQNSGARGATQAGISETLRAAYQKSLVSNRSENEDSREYQQRMARARSVVGLARPDLPRHGKDFARLVQQELQKGE